METLSNITLRPFCLVVAAAFCLAGCSSPEQETSTPQQKNEGGVVDMEIKSDDAAEGTGSEKKPEETSAAPSSGSGSSTDKTEGTSSGLSLTPPKS